MDAKRSPYANSWGRDGHDASLLNQGAPPSYEKEPVSDRSIAVEDEQWQPAPGCGPGAADAHAGFEWATVGLHVLTGIYSAFLVAAIVFYAVKYHRLKDIATYFEGRAWWAEDDRNAAIASAVCLLGPVYYLVMSLVARTTSLRWGLRWGYFAFLLLIALIAMPLLYLMFIFGNAMSHSEQQPSYWNYPATRTPVDSRCDFSIRYTCSGDWELCNEPPYQPTDGNCPVCDDATQAQISTFTRTCDTVVSDARWPPAMLFFLVAHMVLTLIVVLYTGILQCFTCV